MRALGAEVVLQWRDLAGAEGPNERAAAQRIWRYCHRANEPDRIASVARHSLERLAKRPRIDVVLVPLGGGGVSGARVVARSVSRSVWVIAMPSARVRAAHDSWPSGQARKPANTTLAEGLATGSGYELPQATLREHLSEFMLVEVLDFLGAARVML